MPASGQRGDDDRARVILYAGQRRLLAARASHTLTGDGLAPVHSLIVLLLDHAPGGEEVRRIQAQENQREELTLCDQQAQFADCWAARAACPKATGSRPSADLGIGAVKAHNLRRQLTLPEPIRARVAERPAERQLSVTLANDEPLREALWAFLRPMLSPRLAELHRDAFVNDDNGVSTVELTAHRSDWSLDDLDLGSDEQPPTARG